MSATDPISLGSRLSTGPDGARAPNARGIDGWEIADPANGNPLQQLSPTR